MIGDSLYNLNVIDSIEIANAIECDCDELSSYMTFKKNDLTIISQNIRSIYCNFDDFLVTLSTLPFVPDILVLTECRLTTSKPIPLLDNYKTYFTTFQLNQNDGVVVFIKKSLHHKVKEVRLTHASCLQLDTLNNTILCIYRSPSNVNSDAFVDSLCNHLDTLTTQNNIIITGDININIAPKSDEPPPEYNNRTNYLNALSGYGIIAGHKLPTRGKNCLDHFMLKYNKKKISAFIAVLHTTTTDHFTILLSLSKSTAKYPITRTKTNIDYSQAIRDLQKLNLTDLLFCTDPNTITNRLITDLSESIKANTTHSNIPKSQRVIKPWITPGILRCIKNRNKLQQKLRKESQNDILKITYIRYRNYCNNLIKKLKRKYERDLLTKSVGNNKLLWKNIKYITYSCKSHDDNKELINIKTNPNDSANFINAYFKNVGKILTSSIQPSASPRYNHFTKSSSTQFNSFVLLETDEKEVENTLMNLRSSSAPGWDCISITFLKLAKKELVSIITHLVNLCFQQGIFPKPLKKSLITPVYKNGDRSDVGNYRPISILPAISKIIEKLMNTRLLNYLNKYKLLSSTQFGFRQGKSTEDAVAALSQIITEHLDKGNKCLSVFLDLKKAFDTVSIPILVNKLERLGIRANALSLFKSYLSDRTQRVKLNTFMSDDVTVSHGVPQGSVLGPTLFLVYINDLCCLQIDKAHILSYADDTAIIFTGRDWNDVKEKAELGMSLVAGWLKDNLLTLNTDKTNFICYSIRDQSQPNLDFKIKIHSCNSYPGLANCVCPVIKKTDKTKYLGVIVDQRLSWHPHLEQVTDKVRKLIWIFKTLRYVVPGEKSGSQFSHRNILKEIYMALAQSLLTYCIPIWGGTGKNKMLEVERAQRALLKVMHFKNRRFPTDELYSISKVLSVRKLYVLLTVLKKHKTLTYDDSIKQKRTKAVVSLNKSKTAFASKQYSSRSVLLYNKLNKELEIYSKTNKECKKLITNFLSPLNYEETETLLQYRY